MAGYANRVPIEALASHIMPVAPDATSTQAEPILLGSQGLAEVIAVAMGSITDEEKKVPISAVAGLDTVLTGFQTILDDVSTVLGEILAGGD